MIRNARGEGLVSALISVAILGIVIMAVVSLYQMLGDMTLRSNVSRDADALAADVRSVLDSREFCKTALRNSSAGPMAWAGNTVEVLGMIRRGATDVAAPGQPLAGGEATLSSISLAPADVNNNSDNMDADDLAAANQLRPSKAAGVATYTKNAEVILRFAVRNQATGENRTVALRDRRLPVVVHVAQAGSLIVDCDLNDETTRYAGGECTIAMAEAQGANCSVKTGPPANAHNCDFEPHLAGVEPNGELRCTCVERCRKYAWKGNEPTGVCVRPVDLPSMPPPTFACPAVNTQCYDNFATCVYWSYFDSAPCNSVANQRLYFRVCQ